LYIFPIPDGRNNYRQAMATQGVEDGKEVIANKRAEHVESVYDPAMEKAQNGEVLDEFGAHAKTDPKEIALVKKLDWYILVRVTVQCSGTSS
jgi:hypothetical protein